MRYIPPQPALSAVAEAKIHTITELGWLLIPAWELQKVVGLAQPYDPRLKPQA